ncbi:MAG: hypothetical protein P1U55_08990 [Vannielia sp.]|nr:hypothetical protein [Vannielia sp.]
MVTTVTRGTCVSIQGLYVKDLANGLIQVRVGDKLYVGRPVRTNVEAAA